MESHGPPGALLQPLLNLLSRNKPASTGGRFFSTLSGEAAKPLNSPVKILGTTLR